LPSLEEIRSSLDEESKKTSDKPFNGKLSLSGEILAAALFNGLPEAIKALMLKHECLCLAGGYIRDRLNGTKIGDYDFWVYDRTLELAEKKLVAMQSIIGVYYKLVSETESAFTYDTPFAKLQLMKRFATSPGEVIKSFDFHCCKFALYIGSRGRPVLLESVFSREHALCKIMVPIDDLENVNKIPCVIRHLSKLHRKGYRIEDKYLYEILYKYEGTKPENYS
jgi:hypothetical protein